MSAAAAPGAARARELIETLGLQPHPEGGWYAEVYRSQRAVQPRDERPSRAALTGIYFLLGDQGTSRWHVVRSDEVWCHLEGAPLALHQWDVARGVVWQETLGPVADGQRPQGTVAADIWQAAQSLGSYSLVACFVAPGFVFDDFRMMAPDDPAAAWLRANHPALAALL